MKRLLPVLFLFALTTPVFSAPILQLYIEGGTYNAVTESWESDGDSLTLWAIGDTKLGTIEDVHLAISYDSIYAPTISLTPSTTDGYGGVTDLSTPVGTGTYIQTVDDGSSPLLGDGSSLATHGVYGDGTTWQEFDLGDFILSDSPIGDYITEFPDSFPSDGQVNVYDISITGDNLGGMSLHFDLYDHVQAGNHISYKFAPFSHDADGTGGPPPIHMPEPSTMIMLGLGLAGVGVSRRRKR